MDWVMVSRYLFVLGCLALAHSNAQSELCNKCKCKNSAKRIDVDCSEIALDAKVLYQNRSWLDEKNHSIPYARVLLKGAQVGDLLTPFPPSNLSYLDLSRNGINKIKVECFAELQNMETLILSDNNLNVLKPGVLKGKRMDGEDYPLRSLKTLKLDMNDLHTLDQDLFMHVEEILEVLDLSYNPFKVFDLQTTVAIGGIIYLKELYLRFTHVKQLPDHFLHTPRHLKLLDLSGNDFTEIPQGLADAQVLETLYFNNNPIVNITTDSAFPNISTLKVLHLCYNIELESIGARALSNLEHLVELHICNNIKLSHIDPAALSRVEVETELWPPLKKLYLEDNKLASLDSHLVLHWDHLDQLDLRYNPWTCECENQWIVDTLMPIYVKINETIAKEMKCGAPIEMVDHTFYKEHMGNKSMRCLDRYGNRPERDGTILIGVLIGLLLGIPLVLFFIFAYQRKWFGFFDSGPAAYSRQFYRRTRADEI
ncbi:hypothetical protein PPYR_03381 [Photinus pyralis]|uniref:LRRCT domain-containing protein n=1 Tax=Photinus pyralis TaxID=7054 RepID=A0A1Y1LJ54_PHOPY|nr:leucine-rich repeat transmembrane protein FLRT3-like [Photinus pyralis]KAB0791581.1 hypothetical protein PPYR_03381 [Photinus pyralis]